MRAPIVTVLAGLALSQAGCVYTASIPCNPGGSWSIHWLIPSELAGGSSPSPPPGAVPIPPPTPPFDVGLPMSVASANGNLDWHINTAHKFLYGQGYTDAQDQYLGVTNHAPREWDLRRLHLGLTETAHFFDDARLADHGDDADAENGIDTATIFFYAGHGSPLVWNTLNDVSDEATPGFGSTEHMSIGNTESGGLLRYYFQCSCNVFAHGPKVGGHCSSVEYACPGEFRSGASDTDGMHDVFRRWGPALGSGLRMACGMSTEAVCGSRQVDRLWHDYNLRRLDVPDSFVDGFSLANRLVTPLCIALGGDDWSQSALAGDERFTDRPNPFGSTHYYLEYREVGGDEVLSTSSDEAPVSQLPVYELTPAPDGVFDALEALHASGELETRFSIPAHMEVHREPDSGAVYLRPSFEAEPGAHLTLSTSLPAAAAAPAFTDGELRTFAENVVAELGIQEADTARRRVVRRVLARVPRPANPADPVGAMEIRTKGLDLMLRRGIRVGPRVFPVFGNGGLVEVEVGADRTLRGISKIWRTKGAVTRQVRLKSDKDVKAEAKRLIPNAQLYKVTSVVLGYEEQAGNAPQDELVPVFEVSLDPINPANRFTAPPTEVQVPAE